METLRWLDLPAANAKVIYIKNRILPYGVEKYPEGINDELKKHHLDFMELLPGELKEKTGNSKTTASSDIIISKTLKSWSIAPIQLILSVILTSLIIISFSKHCLIFIIHLCHKTTNFFVASLSLIVNPSRL
jgi:hypothetical protein